MTADLDIFIDLATVRYSEPEFDRLMAEWSAPESLAPLAHRVTCTVTPGVPGGARRSPAGWTFVGTRSPVDALNVSIEQAGRDRVPLLVVLEPIDVGCEAIGILEHALSADPMFGFAVPRVGCSDGCSVASLARHGLGESSWIPRRVLVDLPAAEIFAEVVGPCVLIRPVVLTEFGPLGTDFKGAAAALLHYMARARRCGFRSVVCNRAIVRLPGGACPGERSIQPVRAPSARDGRLLRRLVPDLDRSWREFRGGAWERFERLSANVLDAARGLSKPSLLLDIRNVGPIYNGTTRAALGITEGFKRLGADWEITLLANAQAAEFHDLGRVYPEWPICTALPDREFTAALRLSQPWHISELIDLHHLSAFNVCLMLDTISWDAIYPAPTHLDGTWKFLADHADAVLFDSGFTQERFLARFPTDPTVPTFVSHLSFEPTEYVRTDALRPTSGDEGYILVVGNHLDHKDVRPTTELLTTAFPFRRVRVLGPRCPGSRQTVSQPSGQLSDLEVHRLFAHADCVVFPSFYEGFGFPTVMALAYGRTLLARRSALLQEVAARCNPASGRLVAFDRREQLVDLVGRVVHGCDVPVEPLGGALNAGRPKAWRDVAVEVVEFLAPLVRDPSRSRWIARERAIQQLLAYLT